MRWNVSNAEIKRIFIYEIAQFYKLSFILYRSPHDLPHYCQKRTITLARDYSERIEIAELHAAAVVHFAPPLQRVCTLLTAKIAPMLRGPSEREVIGYLFGGEFEGYLYTHQQKNQWKQQGFQGKE